MLIKHDKATIAESKEDGLERIFQVYVSGESLRWTNHLQKHLLAFSRGRR
jgi:hypothetical protein